MADVVLPHTFTNVGNPTIDADQVMANLNALLAAVNALTVENLSPALQELVMQPGQLSMTYADTPDPGFLMCDASFKSQVTYAALFARIGHKGNGGVDPGDGTFRLPGLNKGRVPVGKDAAQAEFNAVGKTAGEKAHTLTAAESGVGPHGHADSIAYAAAGAHAHDFFDVVAVATVGDPTPVAVAAGGAFIVPAAGNWGALPGTLGVLDHAHVKSGGVTAHAGAAAGAAHTNLQPYETVNFQIKT